MAGCSTGIGNIEVKAPNGQPSALFEGLKDMHRGDLDLAYRDYLKQEARSRELQEAPKDSNGEPTLEAVQRLLYPIKLSKANTKFLSDVLKSEEELIQQPEINAEGNQVGFYKLVDSAGNFVKELIRTGAKIAELATGKTKDYAQDNITKYATEATDEAFKGVAKGDTVVKDMIEYTYDEYLQKEKLIRSKGQTKGTLIHLKIQEFLARAYGDRKLARELQAKIEETELLSNIPSNRYDWVTDENAGVWDKLARATGIRTDGDHPTRVHSELRVGDADLGMASTIDILVEDPLTGKMRIADIKSSSKFLDSKNSTTMIYGRELTPIYNTDKDRARLQVVLNAVAIKAGHPEAQFEQPVIAWLPNQEVSASGKNFFNVDVTDYLRMIEKHYQNEYPEAYAKLIAKSPELFNPSHYGASVNASFAQDLIDDKTGMRDGEMLERLKLELERLELEIRLRPNGPALAKGNAYPEEAKKREELAMKILQAESTFALPDNMNNLHEQEIGLLTKWFGVLSDTNNPYLQSFSQSFSKANAAYHAERSQVDQEFNRLLQNAVTKIYGKQSGAKKAFASLDKSKLWDQLLDKKVVKDEHGLDKMTVGMKTENSPGYAALPQELKDLSKFMRSSMRESFEQVMTSGPNAVIINTPTSRKTKLDIYNESKGSNFSYDESFIPKMGITNEEMYARFKKNGLFGKGGAEMVKYWRNKYLTEWFETEVEGDNQQDYGIPIKYVGSTPTITAIDTHSLDLEQSYKKYMEAMLTKKHYDNIYATGMALSGLIRQNNPNSTKTADFLEHAVYRNVLKRGSMANEKLWTHGFVIGRKDGKDVHLSMRKVLQAMSRGVASVGLWLNVPSMVGNAVQAEWAVQKEAILYGMMNEKWSNVSVEDKDLTYKNFVKAKAKVAKMQGDFLAGKGRSNPVHIFMKEFDLYPQIAADPYNLVTGGNKAYSLDHLTIGYQHAEDMTTANLMVTALMTMKVKSGKYAGKSMWDMYEQNVTVDPKTGFGTFKLPADFSRGKLRMGDGHLEAISGLHPLEIQRLKSMTRKLKGGYRKEERSMIEASYLGETFMLFRRWLPATLVGTWKGKYQDITVGDFRVVDQKDGEDVLEWKARVVEGKLTTFFNLMGNLVHLNNSHRWSDLSAEQKKNVMDVGVSFTTWATIAILIGSFFDDDDDKEKKKLLMAMSGRLVEHVQPFSGTQLLEMPAAVKSLQNLTEAMWQMASGSTMYALTGDQDELRTQKGDIRGLKRFQRNVPFGAAIRSAETYLQE